MKRGGKQRKRDLNHKGDSHACKLTLQIKARKKGRSAREGNCDAENQQRKFSRRAGEKARDGGLLQYRREEDRRTTIIRPKAV